MMKGKKFITGLCLLLPVFLLTSCGNGGTENRQESASVIETAETAAETLPQETSADGEFVIAFDKNGNRLEEESGAEDTGVPETE